MPVYTSRDHFRHILIMEGGKRYPNFSKERESEILDKCVELYETAKLQNYNRSNISFKDIIETVVFDQ